MWRNSSDETMCQWKIRSSSYVGWIFMINYKWNCSNNKFFDKLFFLTTIIALGQWTMEVSLEGAQGYSTPLILFSTLCGDSSAFKSLERFNMKILRRYLTGHYLRNYRQHFKRNKY